jgi:hypothetical protein
MQATQGATLRTYTPLVGFAALAALAIFVVAILAAAIGGSIGIGRPAANAVPSAADVNAALVQVRRGERETTTPAQDKAQLEQAMVEFRRGERAPLGTKSDGPDATTRGFGKPVAR